MIPTLTDLARIFARIGILSFGGPAAQIAMMHRDVVDDRRWLTEGEYLSALSFCMLLPGPEAMQLATGVGWRMHGTLGGLITGLLFVLPGALIVLALSVIYAFAGDVPLVAALFAGVQAAVVVIVIEALVKVSRRALRSRAHWVIAALVFVGLFALSLPFPLVVLAAGAWGFFSTRASAGAMPPAPALTGTLRTIALWGAVWLVPLMALGILERGLLFEIGVFFSQLALFTFGGAYAVLAWMTQAVVEQKGWLTLPQMIDGLGLAETTPGPLILVTEFVGFMAAFREGGLGLGLAGAAVTLWMTFAPCFLWIFALAPWIARLTAAPRLAGALQAITAAVVGVIANLSLWFAAHVLFDDVGRLSAGPVRMILPDPGSFDPVAAGIALVAGILLLARHWNVVAVLGVAAALSAMASLV